MRRLARALVVASLFFASTAGAQPRAPGAPPPAAPSAPRGDLIARGQQLFDDQQYEESIQTLSGALVRPNNTKAQKIEIYRLLAFNYITLARREEAESAVRGLLAIEPTYEISPKESPRFRDFFSAVRQKWEAEGRPGLVKETEPPPAPVAMLHASPAQVKPDEEIPLVVHLEDPQKRVAVVKLFYRTGSKGMFEQLEANLDAPSGTARVNVPPSAVKPPVVEYYLLGYDKTNLPVVSRGDAEAPLRIAVPEPSKGWILPVAIGGGLVGAAAIVGGLALAGVFKGSSSSSAARSSTVSINITQ
jgi:hypothetical protein